MAVRKFIKPKNCVVLQRSQGLPGWVAHPESHSEEENEKSLRKGGQIDQNLRENEESGTIAHPGW